MQTGLNLRVAEICHVRTLLLTRVTRTKLFSQSVDRLFFIQQYNAHALWPWGVKFSIRFKYRYIWRHLVAECKTTPLFTFTFNEKNTVLNW